jgi:hypothetical protein
VGNPGSFGRKTPMSNRELSVGMCEYDRKKHLESIPLTFLEESVGMKKFPLKYLQFMAKARGLKGSISRMNKTQLITLILNQPPKQVL